MTRRRPSGPSLTWMKAPVSTALERARRVCAACRAISERRFFVSFLALVPPIEAILGLVSPGPRTTRTSGQKSIVHAKRCSSVLMGRSSELLTGADAEPTCLSMGSQGLPRLSRAAVCCVQRLGSLMTCIASSMMRCSNGVPIGLSFSFTASHHGGAVPVCKREGNWSSAILRGDGWLSGEGEVAGPYCVALRTTACRI
jgi:hypothetical protein